MRQLLSVILMSALFFLQTQAQETIPASGGEAKGNGGSASTSIGQTIFTTIEGTDGSVAGGVQQPYEISQITGVSETIGITLNCSVYPNPTSDYLILKIDDLNQANAPLMRYQLFDIGGNMVRNKLIETSHTSINMTNLCPSTYILKINSIKDINNKKAIYNKSKTESIAKFKIVKK